jgi:putative colanic acid biosysnthesis UDP-glucose lipid carrier transferase
MEINPTRFLSRESTGVFELLNRVLDIAAIMIASTLVSFWMPISTQNVRDWGLLVLILVLANTLGFQQAGLYRSWRGRPYSDQFSRLILAWLGVGAIVVLVWLVFGMSEIIQDNWLIYWLLLTLGFLISQRAALHLGVRVLRRSGANRKLVLIYGAGSLGASIAKQVSRSPESGFQILGFIDDNEKLHGQQIASVSVIGGLSDLQQLFTENDVSELWVALPLSGTHKVTEALEIAEKRLVCVRLFPDIYGLTLLNHATSEMLGFPIIDLNVDRMQGLNRFVKEVEDRVLGFAFFVIALPLIGIISLFIKASGDGPIVYKQRRSGWDGKPFTIYKFRTMRLHQEPEGQLTQAKRDDDRFTPIGRWLRRTSLDELPQLFNVLQGRMSLVGPRPHAIEHDEFFGEQIQGYIRRNRVKPGITGWAQINDLRGEVKDIEEMARRVKHDLYYIEHWSLWFDLRIILATILKIFFSKKAW